jgi:hypothetical protein
MKYRRSFKGLYRPTHPKKYIGDSNRIVYRSLLERRLMVYLDKTDDIISWASEEMSVIYRSPIDKKNHRYFPDFLCKTKSGEKYMIEVKPSRQCKKPKTPKRKTKSFMREQFEWIKNQAKWQAAMSFCEDNNMKFKIMTEKDLGVTF